MVAFAFLFCIWFAVASLGLKTGQTLAPFLVTTSSGARCVVVINATEDANIAKLKETAHGDGILLRNKDVFLPQIVDENGDDGMETGTIYKYIIQT